jgi:hypothetical protein
MIPVRHGRLSVLAGDDGGRRGQIDRHPVRGTGNRVGPSPQSPQRMQSLLFLFLATGLFFCIVQRGCHLLDKVGGDVALVDDAVPAVIGQRALAQGLQGCDDIGTGQAIDAG